MISTGSQTDRALDLLEEGAKELAPGALATIADNPNEAQTPFPTALVLDREQEEALVDFALRYVDNLESSMGRVIWPGGQGQVPVPDSTTHFGRRDLFTLRYYNHVEDRACSGDSHGDGVNLFKVSNITAALSQRIAMQMIARANNYFFATDPWYSVHFVGTEDKPLSERIDRHSKWKFGLTGLKQVLTQATEFAFVRGESVVKTTYQRKTRFYKKKGAALHDGATGQPVLDGKGNHIFGDAAWKPELIEQPPDPMAQAAAMQQNLPIEPMVVETGRQVLRRDPQVYLPEMPAWEEGSWPMRNITFEGPEAKLVYYKDFLCPLDAPDIHEGAELICHLYDMHPMSLISMFKREDLSAMGAGESFAAMKRAVEAIRNLSTLGIEPSSAQRQARGDFGETSNQATHENQFCEVAECYLRYDADGDGDAEEIMLVIDRKNRFPLFYDYLDNVCANGRRPFEVVRAKAVDARWYGMGAMEYFQPEQEFIDLMVNRRNFRMSGAGRVTFFNPDATYEGASNPRLKLNNGQQYRLRPGMKAEDALQYVVLPEEGADLMDFINFFMQLMQLKSGIINAGDQKASGMDTSKTATGVNSVEKSGQEMFAQWLNSLEPGQSAALLMNIRVLYLNLSQPEVYRFFDAASNLHATDILTPEDVADMDFDVSILLTRVRTEQVLQMSAEARALVVEYYTTIPPQVQPLVAPMYRDSLKALGYDNAEQIIQPIPMAVLAQGAGPAGMTPPMPPVPGGQTPLIPPPQAAPAQNPPPPGPQQMPAPQANEAASIV